MTGAIKEFTTYLGLAKINYNFPGWGDPVNDNWSIIDAAFATLGITLEGAWTNSTDYIVGQIVADTTANQLYRCLVTHTSAASGTFAADRAANPTYWEVITSITLDPTLVALAALNSTAGLVTQTAADTFTKRSLQGTANEITVTFGSGQAGNPTISLPAAITLTGKAITGGTFNSGAFNGTFAGSGVFTAATVSGDATMDGPLIVNDELLIHTFDALPAMITPGGRLTLVTGDPTPIDVVTATTLYYTKYKHGLVPLFNTSTGAWELHDITGGEISITNATLAANTNYDVFLFDNAGTLTLELLAWTDATTRATAVNIDGNGLLTKSTDRSRLYVGTIVVNSSSQFVDEASNRYVWNQYNQIRRTLAYLEDTDTWTYNTFSFRPVRGSSGTRVRVIVGFAGPSVELKASLVCSGTSQGSPHVTAIGYESTTTVAPGCIEGVVDTPVVNDQFTITAYLSHRPEVGRRFYAWLECITTSGTSTMYGDGGGNAIRSGINGTWEC